MRILFTVEFYEPRKGGAEEVVRQLATRLAAKGHQVTVATTYLPARAARAIGGVAIESFKISGNIAKGIGAEKSEIDRYQRFLRGDFDVLINYAAQIWTSDLAFPILEQISAKKIFVPCGYSALHDPSFKQYFRDLPNILKRYNKLVYMSLSYQDKIFGDKAGAGNKAVLIPNGAAAEEFLAEAGQGFKSSHGITTKYLAICVANHYRDKGHGFVIEAFKKMSRTDTTLLIIGNNPGNSILNKLKQFFFGCYKTCIWASVSHPAIKLMPGSNRADVVAAYMAADIFLFGSKIECAPLVMYESFASRTAFLTTPVGNVADYKAISEIAASPDGMAAAANSLLNDSAQIEDLTNRAFAVWQEHYTWAKIADLYEHLIQS